MYNIKIDHSSLEAQFIKHLEEPTNKRTLLSGPFGSGKSTFLNEIEKNDIDLASESSANRQFVFLKIQPVNYSIASNDDVFELIKYDLLIELLSKYGDMIDLSDEEFSLLLICQMFLIEKFGGGKSIGTFISAGETIAEIANGPEAIVANIAISAKVNKWAGSLLNGLQIFKKKVEENLDKKTIVEFMTEIESRPGLYSSDPVSQLISRLIQHVKKELGAEVKSVLVVDDMDRLDPEHIFRIFNIFSAHYDPAEDKNKFGFDKIVLVCDLENIRKIFHHRYGPEVDFSGYIDKFFSTEPFYFDNQLIIHDLIYKIFDILNIQPSVSYKDRNPLDELERMISYIVRTLIIYKKLNLRRIVTFPKIELRSEVVKLFPGREINKAESDFYILHSILIGFLHNVDQIIEAIAAVESKYSHDEFHVNVDTSLSIETLSVYAMRICFPVFFIPSVELVSNNPQPERRKIFFPVLGAQVTYEGDWRCPSVYSVVNESQEVLNPFTILRLAFSEAKRRGLLI